MFVNVIVQIIKSESQNFIPDASFVVKFALFPHLVEPLNQ